MGVVKTPAARPTGVYLKNDAATIRLLEGVSELGGKE